MKKYFLILLTALLSTMPLLAQYSPCYEAAFAEGKRLYNAGNYAKAKTYFNEAKSCPDPNAVAADEWIGKCNKMIRKAEEARQKAEQERIDVERKAREEARQRELAAEKKRQEEAERKRLEKEARTRDSIAAVEKRRQEEAERKRKEEETRRKTKSNTSSYTSSSFYGKNTYKSTWGPWEYSFGGGIGLEFHGFNSGDLPVNVEHPGPGGVGNVNINGFFALRKYFGSSDYFFMPMCAVSIGLATTPMAGLWGVWPTLDDHRMTIQYFDDFVFPSLSLGLELDDWAIHIGAGYYMDFMYGASANTTSGSSWWSNVISHDASLLSHYTGGWAGIIGLNNDYDEGIALRLIIGFPKAIDCEVEG